MKTAQLAETLEWIPDDQGPAGPPAPLGDFVSWLIDYGATEELTRRQLWLEYGEFWLVTHTENLSEGQFFRRIRNAGIDRYRESTGDRRWLYRVRKAEIVRRSQSGRAA